ncbi:MAG: trypsin-like peptidase domain-containing protein [Chthoniobacteraceae bacterium]
MNRFVIFLACALPLHGEDAAALLKKLDDAFASVFKKVAPTVVVIEATKAEGEADEPANRPFDFFSRDEDAPGDKRERNWSLPKSPLQSEGSGFVIRADGHIITNRHVVIDSERIEVRGYDGRRWKATLVAADERTDIAVLKVDAADLAVPQWGDSDTLRIGQLVCAIGAPFNQDYSFSCGWVSGKGRSNLLTSASGKPLFEDYIQTDAFINPGNSGGPLFNVEGRVVGMNTLIKGIGRGLAFAIPSNLLRDVAEQLITTGRVRRPWLGVRITSLETSTALRQQFPDTAHGVVINTIEAGTPAATSDLRPGDLVTAIDAVPLRNAQDLVRHVQRLKVGQTIQFSVVRKGETLNVALVTAEQPDSPVRLPRPVPAVPGLGLTLSTSDSDGVLVTEVAPGSPADRADLRPGDIITEVESEPVHAPEPAMKAIESALAGQPKKGALLHFFRDGKKSWSVIERPAR